MSSREKQPLLSNDEDDSVYILTNDHHSAHSLPDLRDDVVVLGVPHQFSFEIEHKKFPEKVNKVQRRLKEKPSMQRLTGGEVILDLHFKSENVVNEIADIEVKVKNAFTDDLSKAAPIKFSQKNIHVNVKRIELNLDSAYLDASGQPVYKLVRTNQEKKKQFHLLVIVKYMSGDEVIMKTNTFTVIGTTKRLSSGSASPESTFDVFEKRMKSGLVDPGMSDDSCFIYPNGSPTHNLPPPHYSDDQESPFIDLDQSPLHLPTPNIVVGKEDLHVQKLVADHIRAKSLEVDEFYGKQISFSNGDIAYHFYLADDDEIFEEGEIVGFVPSSNPDRKQVIQKLTYQTAQTAILVGVITRSQYLEAMVPPKYDTRRTETLCMMGIVPVKVIGSVKAREFLYASPEHPGYAISSHHLPIEKIVNAVVVGVAFESRKTDDESSTGYVDAGVSILQCASQYLVNEKLRKMHDSFQFKIDRVQKSGKKWRRGICISASLTITFLLLLGVLLWQIYTPGSSFRYYKCLKGRLTPHNKVVFWKKNEFKFPFVTGIEFSFDKLKKKLHYPNYRPMIGTARYYMNIHRCAYGDSYFKDDATHTLKEYFIFAVDSKCRKVYYYDEYNMKWKWNNEFDWDKNQNVCCYPQRSNITACKSMDYEI